MDERLLLPQRRTAAACAFTTKARSYSWLKENIGLILASPSRWSPRWSGSSNVTRLPMPNVDYTAGRNGE